MNAAQFLRENPDMGMEIIDGRCVFRYMGPRFQVQVQEQVQEQVQVQEQEQVQEQVQVQEPIMIARNSKRRRIDPTFNALSDDEKQEIIRQARVPTDISKEGLLYIASMDGTGHGSPRNVFVNSIPNFNAAQRNNIFGAIWQMKTQKDAKKVKKIKAIVL